MAYCSNCGTENNDQDVFCSNCGAKLDNVNESSKNTSKGVKNWWDKQTPRSKNVLGISALLLTVLILAAVSVGMNSNKTAQTTAIAKNNTTQQTNTTNSQPSKPNYPEYTVYNSKFQLPNAWYRVNDTRYGGETMVKFAIGQPEDHVSILIKQYKNENELNSDYNQFLESGSGYTVTTRSTNINGISIKVVKTVYDDPISNYETIEDYYFNKNGKYYRVTFDDFRKNKDYSVIDQALNLVISTIN